MPPRCQRGHLPGRGGRRQAADRRDAVHLGYGFGVVDAAAALADQGIAPRRSYMGVMDELWRALRGAPGLVEYADSLTRLNRAKGMST